MGLYEMAQGVPFDPLGSFMEGRTLAANNKIQQNKLADMARADQARPLMGQALQGDKNALNGLASLDPNAYMDVQQYGQKQEAYSHDQKMKHLDEVSGLFNWADTPEKWNQVIGRLESQGHQVDPQERDFNNRGMLLAQTQTMKDQIAQQNADRTFNMNNDYKTQQMNLKEQALALQEQRLAQNGGSGGNPKAPSGYQWNQDGTMTYVKGGPADPANRVPAKALRPTVDQNNAAGFYDRMAESEAVLSDPNVVAAATDYQGKAKANLPFGFGNYMASDAYQSFDQSQRNFVNALLRKESGAAISPSEFENASIQYFPQPGDSESKIAQKARNRATAINAMKRNASFALTQDQPQDQSAAPQDQGGQGDGGDQSYHDTLDTIPEGSVFVDDQTGQAYRMENGQPVPVQ